MDTIGKQILHHMARAFFASAWADQCDECGESSILSGQEIMDIMPDEIDPAAIHAADTLARDMINAVWNDPENGKPPTVEQGLKMLLIHVKQIQEEFNDSGDREPTPEYFGHYCAMQAMGHGVGLYDAFGREVHDRIKVPYCEFGSHSLEKDYFNPANREDE